MRKMTLIAILTLLAIGGSLAVAGPVELFEYAFNVNGTFAHNALPVVGGTTINTAGFDFTTGLGTISINYNPGTTGNKFLIIWLNLDSDSANNTFFNEYGSVNGSAPAGLTWEIDEPGYVFGDIFNNVMNGSLDNTNGVPSATPDDVSVAIGWNFNLAAGESAVMTLNVGTSKPAGFSIQQTDPDTPVDIYLSSGLKINGGGQPPVIPEPSTMVLLGGGLGACLLLRKRFGGRLV